MRHFRLSPCLALLPLLLLGPAGCGGGGDHRETAACVAIVDMEGPALIIAAVQSAATGASIPVVMLSDIKANGLSFSGTFLPPQQTLNVRLVEKGLECTLPCGFSAASGEQSFTVTAPGHVPLKVTAQGAYAGRRGDCPPTLTDGARITLKLEPI